MYMNIGKDCLGPLHVLGFRMQDDKMYCCHDLIKLSGSITHFLVMLRSV